MQDDGEMLPDHVYAAMAVPDRTTAKSLSLRQEIAKLIIAGQWVLGESPQRLAAEFGCSEPSVASAKAEVLRFMRMDLGSPEDMRTQMIANTDRISRSAEAAGEYAAAVSALKLQADVLGLLTRNNERLVIIERHSRRLGNMSAEELEQQMEELRQELRVIDVPSSDSENDV